VWSRSEKDGVGGRERERDSVHVERERGACDGVSEDGRQAERDVLKEEEEFFFLKFLKMGIKEQ